MNNHEALFALLNVSNYQYEFVDADGDIIKVWCESPALLVKDTSTKVVIMATGYGVEWNDSLLGVENASSVLSILSAYFETDETLIYCLMNLEKVKAVFGGDSIRQTKNGNYEILFVKDNGFTDSVEAIIIISSSFQILQAPQWYKDNLLKALLEEKLNLQL